MTDNEKKRDHELCQVKGVSGDPVLHVNDLSDSPTCGGRMLRGVHYDKINGAVCEMNSCGKQAYSVCGSGTLNCWGKNSTCGFKPCGKHLCENHIKQWRQQHGIVIFTSCRYDVGDQRHDNVVADEGNTDTPCTTRQKKQQCMCWFWIIFTIVVHILGIGGGALIHYMKGGYDEVKSN